MYRVIALAVALFAFAASPPAQAHHGWTGYGEDLVTLTGKVLEFNYQNPHGSLRFESADKTWLVVLAPPARMEARGLMKDSLKAGDQIVVEGYQKLTDPQELRAERIRIGDKVIEMRRGPTGP